jgi:integrase
MALVLLTPSTIAKTKVGEGERLEIWDEQVPGLHVRFSCNPRRKGNPYNRVFYYRYRSGGRQRRLKLGYFTIKSEFGDDFRPEEIRLGTGGLTLKEARILAGVQRGRVASDSDPQQQRMEARNGVAEAEEGTFAELAEQYMNLWAKRRKKLSSVKEDQRQIDADLVPRWGQRRAREISKQDVIRLLDAIVERGSAVQANRTRALLTKIFNFGLERDFVFSNPALAARKPTLEKPRDRVLDDEEVQRFWEALERMNPLIAGSFKLKLLTAQRDTEIRHMRWSEIQGDVWTVPAARTKNGREHRVPLSPQARKVLRECRMAAAEGAKAMADAKDSIEATSGLPNRSRDLNRIAEAKERAQAAEESDWVFASYSARGRKGRPIGKTHRAAVRIQEMADLRRFTSHDLRRTAATGMEKLRIDPHIIGKVLNHSDRSITERVYLWHSYDDEKRAALEAWGLHVEQVVTSKK